MNRSIQEQLARLRAENAPKGMAAKENGQPFQISEKGCISFNSMRVGGKFRLTLFPQYVLEILSMERELREFIELHAKELSWR